jgi:hypothetical protein
MMVPPAAKVPLILDAAESSNRLFSYLNATTDDDGNFEFKGLEPGEYLLGVTLINPPMEANPYPKTFYPGVANINEATHLRLSEAEQIPSLEFRLPPKLRVAKLPIQVIWPDGNHVANSRVLVDDTEFRGPPWISPTDAQGQVEAPVFEGREYSVWAGVNFPGHDKPCSGQIVVKAEKNAKPVRVVIDPESGCR